MKVQVIESFSPTFGTQYNVGDTMDVDEKTANSLIAAGRVVKGSIVPFENFQPLSAPQHAPASKLVSTPVIASVVTSAPVSVPVPKVKKTKSAKSAKK
jgi:hypothetical protein